MSSITLSNVSKSYGPATVIDDLSLEIGEGEFITLLGPSGCGKTTTLRSIAGLETPDVGQIRIGERIVTCMTSGKIVAPNKRRLGMVFQSYAIWPHLTVFDNVAYPLRRQRMGSAELRRTVMSTLAIVGLDHAAGRSATQLSGGQQQRVALARAIVANPEVILFDEPLSNLDAQLRITMRDEIQRVTASGSSTSVYVTHDQSEAFSLSDRVAIMLGGRIRQLDAPDVVMNRPADLEVAKFLGIENILRATVVSSASDSLVVDSPELKARLVVRAPRDRVAREGSSVTIAFRSGAVDLVPAYTDGENVVDGEVVQTTFLGEGAQYRITSGGDGTHVLARSHSSLAPILGAGTPVSFRIAPERVTVFTD
jgi:iron(III) transport system ATP-binding protein